MRYEIRLSASRLHELLGREILLYLLTFTIIVKNIPKTPRWHWVGPQQHNLVFNVFLHKPFFVESLLRAVLAKNRSIKANSATFLWHFISNVIYLAWPDPPDQKLKIFCGI